MPVKILVTGGTGYIGSHTVVELILAGYSVIIVDNLSNSSLDVLAGIQAITGVLPEFEKLDLTDNSQVSSFFQKHSDISAVIHFAAAKAVGESVKDPLSYYRNNLVSTLNLLEQKIPNFVFSSSCTVYGQPDSLPVTEKSPRKEPESPYGNTKRINEDMIIDSVKAYPNLSAIILRYFNPIGAHPSGKIGESIKGPPQNLLPFLVQVANQTRKELLVYGGDYHTPDGSAVRDYINVVDLAKAHVLAINRLLSSSNKSPVEIFNLGTGKGVSVLELISTFEKATNISLNYRIVDRRPGDIEQIWADPTFANNELGWKASTNLEETLKSAWNWEQVSFCQK